jgi:hypothetical protein
MDPQRLDALLPFFTTECAVVVHSWPTLNLMLEHLGLLERFLAEEASPHVRSLLMGAVADAQTDAQVLRREFNFNVFDLVIDFRTKSVKIADVLASNAAVELSIEELLTAMNQRPAGSCVP